MSGARLGRREFLRGRAAQPAVPRAPWLHRAAAPSERVVAEVDPECCLGSAYQVCTSCVERCGARGAIRMDGLVPRVDAERCTGCGDCAAGCPAPVLAIRLLSRPAGNGEDHAER